VEHLKSGVDLVAGPRVRHNFFELVYAIKRDGARAGTLFLRTDLLALRERMIQHAGLLGIVAAFAILLASIITRSLQGIIAHPLTNLADLARRIAGDGDFTIRARKNSEDEIGQLIEGFNHMLDQIQQRDMAIKQVNEELESRVAARTQELSQEVETRRQAQEAAEAASKAKSGFLATMSHEIRTP